MHDAARTIWPGHDGQPPRLHPDPGLARQGKMRAAIGLLIALLLLGMHAFPLALIAGLLALTTLLLAVFSPHRAYLRLHTLLARLTALVGQLLTFVVLVPIFFLVITPFGLLFRRGHQGPLRRQLLSADRSYWLPRDPQKDLPERRRRPF